MERPPKKYVCEKCGYFGDTPEHEGCNYLAWTTGEQLYIDQLEAELTALRASPASAPEGFKRVPVEPTPKMIDKVLDERMDALISGKDNTFVDIYKAMLVAAPTPPAEDRTDAEQMQADFNAAIQHAIGLGVEAALFLSCWNEGDWDACAGFGFTPSEALRNPYTMQEGNP